MLRADSRHKCHGKLQESGLPRARTRGGGLAPRCSRSEQTTDDREPAICANSATVGHGRGFAWYRRRT
jgi:hypothetical protein